MRTNGVPALLNNNDTKPAILRNVASPAGHWIDLNLVGDVSKKSPRDAIGSIAYLTSGKIRPRQDVISGAVYCSQNDMTLHFGIGAATKIDLLEIQWSDGARERFDVSEIDRKITIIEGKGTSR